MRKTVVVTGISGQDGAYLSRFLLQKDCQVVGLARKETFSGLKNLAYLGVIDDVILEYCDLSDYAQIIKVLDKYEPDEIYNLAAQSSVSLSFSQPIKTIEFNIISVLNLLEAIRVLNPKIRFYQASSSEMFGRVENLPIQEDTVIHPLSPYAISKASAHWIAINYREVHGLFVSCGILFNHESFLRDQDFFVKKVLQGAIKIANGTADTLEVGNIDVKRDFGFAREYVKAMYLMLQQSEPDDYIVCSGQSISLRSIVEHIFSCLNISLEKLIISERLFRPTDIVNNFGDNKKAKQVLGWEYSYTFYDVLDILLEEELENSSMN